MRGEKSGAYGEEFSPLERVNIILSSLNKSLIKSYAEISKTIKSAMRSIIKLRQYMSQLSMLRLPVTYFPPIFRESIRFEESPIFYLESIKFLFPSRRVLLNRALLNVLKGFRSQMMGRAGFISTEAEGILHIAPEIILSSSKFRGTLGASRLLSRGVVRVPVMRRMVSSVSKISPQIVESEFLRRVEGASLVKEVVRYPKKIDVKKSLMPSLLSVERLVEVSSRRVVKTFDRQLKSLEKSLRRVQTLFLPFPKILEKIPIETAVFASKYYVKPPIFVPRVFAFKPTRLLKFPTLLTSFHYPLMKSASDLSAFTLVVGEDLSRIEGRVGRIAFPRFTYDFYRRVEREYFEQLKILQKRLAEVYLGDKLPSRFPFIPGVEYEPLKRLYSDFHRWSVVPFMSRIFVEKVPSVSSLPRRAMGEVKVAPVFGVKPLSLVSKYYETSRSMLLKSVDVFASPKIQRSLSMTTAFDVFSRAIKGTIVSLPSIYEKFSPSYRFTRPVIGAVGSIVSYGLRSGLSFIYDVFAGFQRRGVPTYNVEEMLVNLISYALPMGKLVSSQLIKREIVEIAKFIPERYAVSKLPLRSPITPLTVVSPVRIQEVIPMLSLMRAPTAKVREPRILKPLNITVKVESLRDERDLRELEKKIAKILREAARKYGVVL